MSRDAIHESWRVKLFFRRFKTSTARSFRRTGSRRIQTGKDYFTFEAKLPVTGPAKKTFVSPGAKSTDRTAASTAIEELHCPESGAICPGQAWVPSFASRRDDFPRRVQRSSSFPGGDLPICAILSHAERRAGQGEDCGIF